MSFSFVEIEEQKTRFIGVLFAVLILFYFFVAWLLIIPCKIVFFPRSSSFFTFFPALKESLAALILATVAGVLHWHFSVDGVVGRTLASIRAQPADENDALHHVFMNVVEEASVASGGKKVEPWIISASALNAFALSDFSQRCVIGVTEGLLARLNRSQLEAVVGHEFGHILSGDSKMTTVTASLFGIYSILMDGIKKVLQSNNQMRFSRSRGGGWAIIFLWLVYLILAVTRFMSGLLSLFLSRQREYRADAISVRLSRNPLALAEALQVISRGWRGAYLSSEYLASIFIMNPAYRAIDESEGFLADLFSTHPPIQKRIQVVLDMAHVNVQDMLENLQKKQESAREQRTSSAIVDIDVPQERWFLAGPQGQWQGPFTREQLGGIPWFGPETWSRKETGSAVQYAWQDGALNEFLQGNQSKYRKHSCPRCTSVLSEVLYEGAPLWHCRGCGGNLLERSKIMRILARKQQVFSPEVIQQAEILKRTMSQNKTYSPLRDSFHGVYEFTCPECGRKMQRKFYNFDYVVEIDLCAHCDIIWFDKNELEVLQFLFEEHAG